MVDVLHHTLSLERAPAGFKVTKGGLKVWRQTHFFQKIDLLFQLKELFIPVTNHHFKQITSENVCETKTLAFAINMLHLQSHVMV